MSSTAAAMYYEEEGRFVDPTSEPDLAEQLWRSAPARSGLGLQAQAQLGRLQDRRNEIDSRMARIGAAVSSIMSGEPWDQMSAHALRWASIRMGILSYGRSHVSTMISCLLAGKPYEPLTYDGH